MTKYPQGYKGPRPIIACWRCHTDKPRSEYSIGKSGKRISPVCMTCIEAEAIERDARKDRRRATKVDQRTRRVIRRCAKCHEWKDLKRGYYKSQKAKPGSKYPKPVVCKVCADANKRAWEQAHSERHKATHREAAKRYRARHPGRRHERDKKRWAAIKADPIKHAQVLEDHRINRRIRKARRGQATATQRPRVSQPTGPSYLPSRPLMKLITARIDHQLRLNKLSGTEAEGKGIKAVCQSLGTTDRTYRRWLAGEQTSVRVGTAESILLKAGVEWHELYPDHAAQFLATEMAA